MIRLRDIKPAEVAQQAHDALLSRLSRLAMACGVTDPLVPSIEPSDAYAAVSALATYATTGAAPEGRVELVPEYQQAVAEIADWLGEFTTITEPETPIQVVLSAAGARLAVDSGQALTTSQLAVLASMSRGRAAQLQAAGDAPRGRRSGKARLVSAAAAREWLSGRAVTLTLR